MRHRNTPHARTATGTSYDVIDWRQRAACRDEDPELFFPIGNTGPAILQINEAKAVCAPCPVREQCLTWALETNQQGVWGGLSEDERRALKRRTTERARRARRAAAATT